MKSVANHDAKGAGKQSNPKDSIGSKKLAMGLAPDTIKAHVRSPSSRGR
jgi:hypothetical protein